jgi:fused signal recognition particle receptor
MFRFFRKKEPTPPSSPSIPLPSSAEPLPEVAVNSAINSEVQSSPRAVDVEPKALPATAPPQSTERVARTPSPEESPPEKTSWIARLRQGLARTGRSISGVFVGSKIDEALFEELESALIMADASAPASGLLIASLRARVRKLGLETPEQVREALIDVLADHLRCLEKPFDVGAIKPMVVMIAGVNGAGKTTSIGKLAYRLRAKDARVLLAAGDTFRAAAREQLIEWGNRNDVAVIAQEGGDPAAVAFDAVAAGRARGMDVVMVDTAGRLPTQLNLMAELKKIRRVINKADEAAPHEVLLVVDGNTGQNALAQIKAFDEALTLTGLIVTKLDGTAKGGVLAALAAGANGCRPIPVYWIGVGEQLEDLQPFVAREFAEALIK